MTTTHNEPAIESHRLDREQDLAALLLVLFDQASEHLLVLLGTPPSIDNIPQWFWDDLAREARSVLADELAATHTLAATLQSNEFGTDPSDNLDAISRAWARQHVDQLVANLIANTQQMARDAVQQWNAANQQNHPTAFDIAAAIAIALGISRAMRIATTETTRAITSGSESAADQAFAESGGMGSRIGFAEELRRAAERGDVRLRMRPVVPGKPLIPSDAGGDGASLMGPVALVAYWQVEDGTACPICLGLNGLPQYEWPEEYSEGPPSPHANCRCWLRWMQIVAEFVDR